MSPRSAPRAAIVTGGAKGIGRAISGRLAEDGTRVAIFGRDTVAGSTAESELAGLPGEVRFFPCDVGSEIQIVAATKAALDAVGPIDALVNNAGVNAYFGVDSMTESEWEAFFAVDLKASWLCSKHLVPQMQDLGGGSIVNISSIHSVMTRKGMFPYAAAKSGLVGLTRTMAVELGQHEIRVNAVCPGFIKTTPVLEKIAASEDPAATEARILGFHPLGRIGEPEDVAGVVAFLLSTDARFVTGAAWFVDGGLSCRFAV